MVKKRPVPIRRTSTGGPQTMFDKEEISCSITCFLCILIQWGLLYTRGGKFGMFFDQYYLVLVVPTLILALFAQIMVKSTFSRYSKILSRRHITGADVARLLMRTNRITDVQIEAVPGSL